MTRGIDHLVLCVNDLEKARAVYEALGFTMTPAAQHPFGTGNIIAQLDGCFLEVLSVTRPELLTDPGPGEFSFPRFNEAFLTKREGMSMLVLDSTDEDADRAEFAAKNLNVYAPFTFERLQTLPSGETATVGFSLTFLDDPVNLPGLAFFTCKQWRPDLFWKPEYQRHANGATSVADVFVVADNVAAGAAFHAAFAGAEASGSDENMSVATSRGSLSVMSQDVFAERFPGHGLVLGDKPTFAGYKIQVRDLATTKDLLLRNSVPTLPTADRCYVPAASGLGCVIEFSES